MNGHTKTKANGHAGPAKAAPPPPAAEPPKPAPPADPLVFVDEFPTRVRTAIENAAAKQYAAGMRRAMQIIAIAVGRLDGDNKTRLTDALDTLEAEAAKAEKAAAAPPPT